MQTIDTQDLKAKLGRSRNFALVEVLSADDYESGHIPQAINIPLDDDFEAKAQAVLRDKDQQVIVYCASPSCDASPKAAKRLEQIGFNRVLDYEGGKRAWRDAGLGITVSA